MKLKSGTLEDNILRVRMNGKEVRLPMGLQAWVVLQDVRNLNSWICWFRRMWTSGRPWTPDQKPMLIFFSRRSFVPDFKLFLQMIFQIHRYQVKDNQRYKEKNKIEKTWWSRTSSNSHALTSKLELYTDYEISEGD